MYDEYIEEVMKAFGEADQPLHPHDISLAVVDAMCGQGVIDPDIDSVDLAMMQYEQRVTAILEARS